MAHRQEQIKSRASRGTADAGNWNPSNHSLLTFLTSSNGRTGRGRHTRIWFSPEPPWARRNESVELGNAVSKPKSQSTKWDPSNMLVSWTLPPSPSNQQLMRTNKCQCNSSLERCIDIILPVGMRWNCSISRLFIFPTFKYSYKYFWSFLFPIALNEK